MSSKIEHRPWLNDQELLNDRVRLLESQIDALIKGLGIREEYSIRLDALTLAARSHAGEKSDVVTGAADVYAAWLEEGK